MGRIFVDTNVLFPFSVMDLLLALSEDGIHEVIWTETLLDEWEEVIVREHHRTAETAASITAAIREFFSESDIKRSAYKHLLREMPDNDPDDHEHMAPAIVGGASILVTRNVKDFPADPLARHGLRVVEPDTYLCEPMDDMADEMVDTVVRLADEERQPPKAPDDLVADLERADVPRLARQIQPILRSRRRR